MPSARWICGQLKPRMRSGKLTLANLASATCAPMTSPISGMYTAIGKRPLSNAFRSLPNPAGALYQARKAEMSATSPETMITISEGFG
jgi:hypothetical protein